MTTKMKDSSRIETSKRPKPSARPDDPPDAVEMAQAARELHAQLSRVVAEMDRAASNAGSSVDSDSKVWSGFRFVDHLAASKGASREPAIVLAVRAYAERRTRTTNRMGAAIGIGAAALDYANGKVTALEAVETANKWRRGCSLNVEATAAELKGAVGARRKEQSRFQAAYNVLAWDADVDPRPDTHSGMRPDDRNQGMADLYRRLTRTVDLAEVNRDTET